MNLSIQDERELELLEEGLWRVEVRFDPIRMDELLAPDFFEIGRFGRTYRREDIMGTTVQSINARLPLMEFRARLLAPNIAQVIYVSTVTYQGVEELAYRSSIWSRAENGWKLRFHQGTAIPN